MFSASAAAGLCLLPAGEAGAPGARGCQRQKAGADGPRGAVLALALPRETLVLSGVTQFDSALPKLSSLFGCTLPQTCPEPARFSPDPLPERGAPLIPSQLPPMLHLSGCPAPVELSP